MKKILFRIVALGVALAFPTGVFAQTTSTEKKTETKSSTNPVTGSQTQSTETKMESKDASGKKTSKKKKTTKKSKKGKKTTTTEEKKVESNPK